MGKKTKTALVVLDNTILTNFGLLHRSALVTELWPEWVCSTPDVMTEYNAGVQAVGLPPDAWNDLPVLGDWPKIVSQKIKFHPANRSSKPLMMPAFRPKYFQRFA
jgi:hypothetical protein